MTKLLNVPFPLRYDFIATVQVPRVMTEWEAKRLAGMVLTLGIPTPERMLLTAISSAPAYRVVP